MFANDPENKHPVWAWLGTAVIAALPVLVSEISSHVRERKRPPDCPKCKEKADADD